MTRRSTAVAILVTAGSSQAQSPTVTGLGSVWFDIDTCNAGSGPWTLSGEGYQAGATATTWGMRSGGTEHRTPRFDGSIDNISASRFVPPGGSANGAHPINEICRGKWTPSPAAPISGPSSHTPRLRPHSAKRSISTLHPQPP